MTKVIFGPTFTKLAKKLRRKFPRIQIVIENLADQLEEGETPGDRLQSLNRVVYKVRLPNPDAQRGKSGGYRVIYYIKTAERVALLLIYPKVDVENVPLGLIEAVIQEIDDLEAE